MRGVGNPHFYWKIYKRQYAVATVAEHFHRGNNALYVIVDNIAHRLLSLYIGIGISTLYFIQKIQKPMFCCNFVNWNLEFITKNHDRIETIVLRSGCCRSFVGALIAVDNNRIPSDIGNTTILIRYSSVVYSPSRLVYILYQWFSNFFCSRHTIL